LSSIDVDALGRNSGRLRAPTVFRFGREYGIVAAFILLFIVLAATTGNFLTNENLSNVVYQNAPLGIIAVGITIPMVTGGFDLSTGSVVALAGVVSADLANHFNGTTGILLTLAIGLAVGVANGLLITIFRLNSFLATLASGLIIGGITLRISGGFLIQVADPTYGYIGSDSLFGVKYASWTFLFIAVLFGLVLSRTTFGRRTYAVGGNAQAARLAGVRVNGIRIAAFAISGLCASLAGVLLASRVLQGQANVGSDLTLTAIAAVVVGGTSIMGGSGAVWRTVLGVFFLSLISNAFDLSGFQPFWRQILTGLIIVIAVAMNAYSRSAK
jgi:ribose transport system permease protein